MASGVAYRLHKSGLAVLMTEVPHPLAVRRAVSFCEAIHDGTKVVEGVTARRVEDPDQALAALNAGELPVLVDPELTCLPVFKPLVVVDALLAKRNTGTHKGMAELVIGMGPGFKAPEEVHLALETMRGHNLGRLIYQGSPAPDTGIPGEMAGYTHQRVLRAPRDGVFTTLRELGDTVAQDETVAKVDGDPVTAGVGGVIRGLLRHNTPVNKGDKVGDVDPRGQVEYLNTISEKARALGGSVLEGIMARFNRD